MHAKSKGKKLKFLASRTRQYVACALISFVIGGILLLAPTWSSENETTEEPVCTHILRIPYPPAEANKTQVEPFAAYEYIVYQECISETGDFSCILLKTPSNAYLYDSNPTPLKYYIEEEQTRAMGSTIVLKIDNAQTTPNSFHNPATLPVQEIPVFLGGITTATGGSFLAEAVKYKIQRRKKWFTVKSLTILFVILQTIDAIQTALVFPWGEGNVIWSLIARNSGYWAWLFFPLKAIYVLAVTDLALRSDLIDRSIMKKLLFIINFFSQIFVISNFFALTIFGIV